MSDKHLEKTDSPEEQAEEQARFREIIGGAMGGVSVEEYLRLIKEAERYDRRRTPIFETWEKFYLGGVVLLAMAEPVLMALAIRILC